MPKKSPFTKAIYDEWERLAFFEGKPTGKERKEGSRDLYAKCWSGRKWLVKVQDATLASSLELVIAMELRKYHKAALICRRWLEHPGASQMIEVEVPYFNTRLGAALILQGKVQAGVSHLRSLLRGGQPGLAEIMLSDIRRVAFCLDADQAVDPLLVNLATDIAERIPRKKRTTKLVSRAQTNRELSDALERARTHRPRPKTAGANSGS